MLGLEILGVGESQELGVNEAVNHGQQHRTVVASLESLSFQNILRLARYTTRFTKYHLLITIYYILYIIDHILFSLPCTLYSIPCTLYSLLYSAIISSQPLQLAMNLGTAARRHQKRVVESWNSGHPEKGL